MGFKTLGVYKHFTDLLGGAFITQKKDKGSHEKDAY
jgi:hypothetical protein